MNQSDTPAKVGSSAGLGLAASATKPRAWAIFTEGGNARMWGTLQPHLQKLADSEGLLLTPMYDQVAIDAAVAAERERWQRIATNAQAVTTGCEDKIDHFEVPSHLMAALALALDEGPNVRGNLPATRGR